MNNNKWASENYAVVIVAKIVSWHLFFLFVFFHGCNQHNTGDIFVPGVHWGSHALTVTFGQDPEKLLKFLFPPRTPKTCSDRPWTWLCLLIICVQIYFFLIDFNFITCRWWKIGIFYDSLKSNWVHSLVYLLFASHFSDTFAWHCRCSCPALRSDHFSTVFWEMLIADSTSVYSSLNLLPAICKTIIVAVISCLFLNDSRRVLYKVFYVLICEWEKGMTDKNTPWPTNKEVLFYNKVARLVWFPDSHLIKKKKVVA